MQAMTPCVLESEDKYSPSNTGSPVLSQREVEVLVHVAVGFKEQEIADKLCISPNTVNTHLHNVYKKINVPNCLQAILWAAKNM